MAGKTKAMPIISKTFCSSTQVILGVRSRPHIVSGGGFVVCDVSTHKIIFRVDGCGVLGKKEQLILSDADHNPLLLFRRKGGMVEALIVYRQWRGYTLDYQGSQKLVFTLKEPNSCLVKSNPIRVSIDQKDQSVKCRNFQINGYFPDRQCSIIDSGGNIIAQIGVRKEVQEVMESKDLYHVVVQPGVDQAFVVGVIAVLDFQLKMLSLLSTPAASSRIPVLIYYSSSINDL